MQSSNEYGGNLKLDCVLVIYKDCNVLVVTLGKSVTLKLPVYFAIDLVVPAVSV